MKIFIERRLAISSVTLSTPLVARNISVQRLRSSTFPQLKSTALQETFPYRFLHCCTPYCSWKIVRRESQVVNQFFEEIHRRKVHSVYILVYEVTDLAATITFLTRKADELFTEEAEQISQVVGLYSCNVSHLNKLLRFTGTVFSLDE